MARWDRPTGIAATTLLLLYGCTQVSTTERFAGAGEVVEILATVPFQGQQGVDPRAQIDLCFSALVDPRSVSTVDATISSGRSITDSALSLQLWPWQGPGGTAPDAAGPWCEGSVLSVRPRSDLLAGLLYRLRLVPRARGWRGELLDTEGPGWTNRDDAIRFALEFTIDPASPSDPTSAATESGDSPQDSDGQDPDTGIAPSPMPQEQGSQLTFGDLYASGQIFDPQRSTCGCHRESGHLARARLDLSDPDRAYRALVVDPRPRDTGFPMVSPRRPSESFLLHKLLRDDDGQALHTVLGSPMPANEPIPYTDYVALARWIEAGAFR